MYKPVAINFPAKIRFICGSIFFCIFLFSCKKTTTTALTTNTFVKTIQLDSNYEARGCAILSDGNYLIYSTNVGLMPTYNSAVMTKMSTTGKIIWQKYFPSSQNILWTTLPLPGGGFISAGFNHSYFTTNFIILYSFNNDGVSTSTISIPLINQLGDPKGSSLSFIPMNNGNFALCYYDTSINLDIFNANLSLLTHKQYQSVIPYRDSIINTYPVDSLANIPLTLCQNNTGGIEISSFLTKQYLNYSYSKQMLLLRTDETGNMLSYRVFPAGEYSESPTGIINDSKGNLLLAETSVLNTYSSFQYTAYIIQNYIYYWAGAIGIDKRDSSGNEINTVNYAGYAPQGFIKTIHPTGDGGYILCGTEGMNSNDYIVSNSSIYLLKVDANLNTDFSVTIPSVYPTYGMDAIQVSDGGYLVTGYIIYSSNTHFEPLVIKTDANGRIGTP